MIVVILLLSIGLFVVLAIRGANTPEDHARLKGAFARGNDRIRDFFAEMSGAPSIANEKGLGEQTASQSPSPASSAPLSQREKNRAHRETEAQEHLSKDGLSPDSTLECIIQTGGPSPDFLEGIVGSYHGEKLLRIVMQNDESDDPSGYWHSWDVPWEKLVEIVLRARTTPLVGTNTRQPDGTYARRGPYLQTRLYKVGRGIECRLLDPDGADMERGEPYQWLKSNVLDRDVRFSKDTQEDPQYGDDGQDQLDGYTLNLETREEREPDEAAARRAVLLSDSEIVALMSARPEKVRSYFGSQKYTDALDRRIAAVRSRQGTIAQAELDHVRRVIELAFAGAIPRSYSEMFFYIHFPTSGTQATAKAKADLVGVVRLMLQELPYFESS